MSSSMRGVTDCIVSVGVLRQAVHSGSYGGPIPDALVALCRMLASLHDATGDVAIAGLDSSTCTGIPVDVDEFRDEAGVLPGVGFMGTGPIADRLFTGPAVSVLGIDAPSVAESSNQLVPTARARVSLRLAPGQDAPSARDALAAHLRSAAPWGVQVEIQAGEAGAGYVVDRSAAAYVKAKRALSQAWDHEVVETGDGGSIPLVALMAEAFPGIAALIFGASDEVSNTHSLNESVDLSQVEKLAVAEALLIQELGSP